MIINLPCLSQAKIVIMPNTGSKECYLFAESLMEASTDMEVNGHISQKGCVAQMMILLVQQINKSTALKEFKQ